MSNDIVTTNEGEKVKPALVLLKPSYTPARTGKYFNNIYDGYMVPAVVRAANKSTYLAVDFETRGNDYTLDHSSFAVVGLGLAYENGSCYFAWDELNNDSKRLLTELLLTHQGLLAHNVYFDGGVIASQLGGYGNFSACTLALYMFLSNEGFAGQQWGLKSAQVDILKWADSNEKELDEWLIVNGYYKGVRLKEENPEYLLTRARDGSMSPDKGEMWRAPKAILGKYCILDAESCYLLFTKHLLPMAEKFPDFYQWFQTKWIKHINVHIWQKQVGIMVDRPGLLARQGYLDKEIADLATNIREHPELKESIKAIEGEMLKELMEAQPEQYLKPKPRPPEPARHKKDGSVSKTWIRWVANKDKYLPVISKNYTKWQAKVSEALSGNNVEYKFNIASTQQLANLFYTKLGYPVRIYTPHPTNPQPAAGVKAFKHFGAPGLLLTDKAYKEKERGYILDYIDRTTNRPSIHPSYRLPGTKTGRLSSKSPNLQQVPKSKGVMGLFKAKPGYLLVDIDFAALESMVAAELSGDPNLTELYGDGKPENDIHLFVGAQVAGIREKILATGYTPINPKAGTVSKAKKECKAERNIMKATVYACQFGAGVDKVLSLLEADDIDIDRGQVETIHRGYCQTFKRLKQYSYELREQWQQNGGYVLNGLGRPMCVTPDYKHDILNRVVQSTGHDILVAYGDIMYDLLNNNVPSWGPLVWDWHDALTVQVPIGQEQATAALMLKGMDILNSQLNNNIKLKGKPTIGISLADVKEAEE